MRSCLRDLIRSDRSAGKITLFTVNQRDKTKIGIQLTKHADLSVNIAKNRPSKYCSGKQSLRRLSPPEDSSCFPRAGSTVNVNRHSTAIRSILNESHVNTAVQLHVFRYITWTLVPSTVLVFVGSYWSSQSKRDKSNVQRTSNCLG